MIRDKRYVDKNLEHESFAFIMGKMKKFSVKICRCNRQEQYFKYYMFTIRMIYIYIPSTINTCTVKQLVLLPPSLFMSNFTLFNSQENKAKNTPFFLLNQEEKLKIKTKILHYIKLYIHDKDLKIKEEN